MSWRLSWPPSKRRLRHDSRGVARGRPEWGRVALRTIKKLVVPLALLLIPAFFVKRYLVHPSPSRILTKTIRRYSTFEFYSDTTTVRSSIPSLQGTYEFTYARPNRLRVQFRGLLNDELVVADGTTLYVYRPAVNQYRAAPAPQQLPDELPGGQPMLKLSLLNGTMPVHRLGNARYRGRAKWQGQWVHRLRVEAEDGELGEGGVADMVLWIGAEDSLIYRSDTTLALGTQTVTQSLEHGDISTAPPPAGAFIFEPPEGARPVARFQKPRLESDTDGKARRGTSEMQD